MFYKKTSKKRKKETTIYNIFIFFILIAAPFVYKIYISSYIKNTLIISFKIEYIEIYKEKIKDIYFILFNKYYLQILIPLLFVYNFYNTFKTFTLIISLLVPLIISQILNIYLIKTIKDENDINNELLFATGYPLFLWKILSNSELGREKTQNSIRSMDTVQKNHKTINNIKSLVFVVIFILFQYLIYFILFNDVDKIIFDAIMGLIVYFIFFHIFKIETNNPRHFINIIEFKLKYYFLIFLFFNLFFIIFCIDTSNNNEDKNNIIKKIIYKYSFTSIVIGIILGTKYEYNFYFEKKLNIWAQYNFESDFEASNEEEEESLSSIISSSNKKQWNNTSFSISLLRLIFIIVVTFGCLYSFIFLKFDNFILEIFMKYILPINLFSLGLFYWYKLILKYLKVTNILLLTSFRESF